MSFEDVYYLFGGSVNFVSKFGPVFFGLSFSEGNFFFSFVLLPHPVRLASTAVPTPLISTPPSQPHTGPLCRNLRARSPQGATNVRPPRGHLPEETLHFY
ncbi:hypothetical protein ACOMHN_059465 [Nucella lapillus]